MKKPKPFIFIPCVLAWVALSTSPLAASSAATASPSCEVQWLEGDDSAVHSPGTTWGAPWPRGAISRDTTFALRDKGDKSIPMQSWPLAYWPDGSLKWTAHAIGPSSDVVGPLRLEAGQVAAPAVGVSVSEDPNAVVVDTGLIQCRLNKSGGILIDSIARGGKTLASNGRLVCLLRSSPDLDAEGTNNQDAYYGEVSTVKVEQAGPVRAVVKIEGKHAGSGGRAWLPFVVRMYFYAGGDAVRVVHTITYDGDQSKDFISGLGVRFSVPMKDELYDRHVRFGGDDNGVWGEAVLGLTGLQRDPGQKVRDAQVEGRATPPIETWAPHVAEGLGYVPAFGDFTLSQLSPDSFEIRKRTKAGFTWLNSATGHRASGLGYVGGPSGGVAFGIRNFWQSYPSQLSIRNATTDNAEVTAWLWSPEARPMDMRFFHDDMGMTTFDKQNEGGAMTYEDYEPGFATATGVARTSELMLWTLPATPSHEETAGLSHTLTSPPQLVCAPQDLKKADVFGGAIWGLPNLSNPLAARIENQLNALLDFYKTQIDERHWYGYWYYGNVMHRYDFDRHVWRYDVGAYAWDNSEQSTDVWLWYSFLRTGRADVFRMAEAMTRHTGEVDVYHLGRFAGLGTRHGVVPWGDSSKQLRVSTAENRRFFYYLTADERVGDLMREELDADRKAGEIPVERKVSKEMTDVTGKPYHMQLLVGIEWTSVASAWLTEWERTGDTKYRDKIVTGMKSIAALPHGWMSGGGGYDPDTGRFFKRDDEYYMSPLSASFGAFEVNAELLQLLDVPEYEKTWLDYCKYYNASPVEQRNGIGKDFSLYLTQAHSRLTAYAAWKLKDPALAKRAWTEFLSGKGGGMKVSDPSFQVIRLTGPAVLRPVDEADVSTNMAVGFGLSAIDCLSLVPDQIPSHQ